MMIGAEILNIVTKSLYDKPIVVFREYIQNSVDSFRSMSKQADIKDLKAIFWNTEHDLFFLDNGQGVDENSFETKIALTLGKSDKNRIKDIGYKGIGRLSGISYCNKLEFINILNFQEKKIQSWTIDCMQFKEQNSSLDIDEVMNKIGELNTCIDQSVLDVLNNQKSMFKNRNTGFLVILREINTVLREVMDSQHFKDDLNWLLPVDFDKELFQPDKNRPNKELLFSKFTSSKDMQNIIAKGYNIFYDTYKLERPIKNCMLRTYLCKTSFCNESGHSYAECFYTFNNSRITLDKKNPFSGIKIYVDNMLLCDENEFLPILSQLGYIEGSVYELIQSVRGIGAMVYITDKENISVNARRTFIEITDEHSLLFLKALAQFVESIFDARYALSGYRNGINKYNDNKKKLAELREKAINALKTLASDTVKVQLVQDEIVPFDDLNLPEKRRVMRKCILNGVNEKIKEYWDFLQPSNFKTASAFDDFIVWAASIMNKN